MSNSMTPPKGFSFVDAPYVIGPNKYGEYKALCYTDRDGLSVFVEDSVDRFIGGGGYDWRWIAPEGAHEPSQVERLEGASMPKRPTPPEGYEFCTWKEAERDVYDGGRRRGLYRDHSGEWHCDIWFNYPDVVAEGRLIWLRKVPKPEPPEGYEFCTWEEAERGAYGERRGLYRDHSGEWRCGPWINRNLWIDCGVAEGRLIWLRKIPDFNPRRWSSPDGSVVYEEVERFEDADYAGTLLSGDVLRTHLMGDENGNTWYVHSSPKGCHADKWVRRVLAK